MKRTLIFCCLAALTLPLFAAEPTPTPVTQVRELFNGKDFTNWYKWVRGTGRNDPNGVFTVQDGCIRVSGQEFGCVTTEEAFENYRVDVEFRWGKATWGGRKDKARDSGLLIHSVGEDGAFGGIWMKSVEANIVEGGIGDFWIVGHSGQGVQGTCKVRNGVFDPQAGIPVTMTANGDGCFQWSGRDPGWKDVLGFRGANDIDKPNDWNTLSVVADGDKMTVYLNGTLINEVTNLLPKCGKIQLQSEGAEIFFRRVTIRPLEK